MSSSIRHQLEACIEDLRDGELTKESLERVVESLDDEQPKRQDLLYLQAGKTSVISPILGMAIVQDGEASDGPADPDDWPYQTVLEAMRDGWRIIKFPEMALLLDEERTYGLGCEFILERWS